MVKMPQNWTRKALQFLQRKAYEWGSGGTVAWYGGYPYFFQDKKARLDNNTIIQACLGWEARNFAEPPVCVQTITDKGTPENDFAHELAALFRRPEFEGKMTGRRLMKAVLASRRLDGNAYLDIIPDATGKPRELRYIPFWAIEPVAKKGTGILDHYEITMVDGRKETRKPNEVLHFADGIDDKNPLKGCSALKTAMRLVMTDDAAAASAERMMRNLGVIGLMVSPKNGYKLEDKNKRDALSAQLTQQFAGEGQGSVLVGSGEMDVNYLGADASKLGFREMHRIPEERITAIFGYAAIVIGLGAGLDRSTFANFSEAREAATEQTLVPLWAELADDITVQLGPRFKLKENQVFAYDLKNVKILQEDEDKRWTRLGGAFQNGGIKRSEYRIAIGYESASEDEVYITDIQAGGAAEAGKTAETNAGKNAMRQRMKRSREIYEQIQSEISA